MKISKIYRLVEARFPDEKFWNKDGTPIYNEPKGPPKGTVGKTHADLGASSTADPDPADYGVDGFYSDEENIGDHDAEQRFPGSIGALKSLVDPKDCSFDVMEDELVAHHWDSGEAYVWNGRKWRSL